MSSDVVAVGMAEVWDEPGLCEDVLWKKLLAKNRMIDSLWRNEFKN